MKLTRELTRRLFWPTFMAILVLWLFWEKEYLRAIAFMAMIVFIDYMFDRASKYDK